MTNFRLKRYQKDFDHSYTFGVFATLELLDAHPEHLLRVILASRSERNFGVTKLRDQCIRHHIPLETSDDTIERLSPRESHMAVGVFRKYKAHLSLQNNHVVLVNPGDMGNLGTIARTMIGFGITDLALIRPAVDIFDPKAIRASMGAILRLSFEYFDHFDDYHSIYPDRHLYPLMTGEHNPVSGVTFQSPFSLIFGNESSGLPEEFREHGVSVTIPHSTVIDSLNLSTAAAIALYESTRGNF